VKRLLALLIATAFAAGMVGSAQAQAPSTPAPKADKQKSATQTVSGTVKTAAVDSLVVSGKAKGKDAEWTFAVDPKTKIRKGSKDASAADLAAGDVVNVRYHAEGGKNIAESVTVSPPKKTTEAPKKDQTKK
jgi:hypothetical protein